MTDCADLTLQKWDSVIVDWVNCLEIAKRVQNVHALKSGEFFKALVDLLQPDLPTTLGEFLRTHYPNFELGGGGNAKNLTDAELTAAASLLLHFMCIHDRRDELIAPMCHRLDGAVQTYVKEFLEHFTHETTAAQFNDVVRKSVEGERTRSLATPQKVLEWNSSGESPFVRGSPLLEYFKTPAAKTAKMQEKDREIRRLQQELQLERDEKEDMNVEMREQKHRIQKISLEVQEKSRIISSLSARLTELEEQPPTSKPRELIEIEKLLRSELAEAQNYICELQAEHGELTIRKEELSRKLSSAEEQSCMWQSRAVQSEAQLEVSVTKYKSQSEELFNLQTHCQEMTLLLDEFRAQKLNHAHLDLDNSVSTVNIEPKSSDENLADTVVELQLKECQLEMQEVQAKLARQEQQTTRVDEQLETTLKDLEECRQSYRTLEAMKHDVDVTLDRYILTNEKLETQINELARQHSSLGEINKSLQSNLDASIRKSQELEDELVDIRERLEDANCNHQRLMVTNEEITEQLQLLRKSEQGLLRTNAKVVKRVDELAQENLAKDEELGAFKRLLSEREDVIRTNEELTTSLKHDLQVMEDMRDDYDDKLREKNRVYDVLEEESRLLQVRYEEAVRDFNQTDFNLQALTKQMKESDNKMQVSLDKLDELLTGSIESANDEKIQRIDVLIEKLKTKHMTFENTIENLRKLNVQLEEEYGLLQKEDSDRKENLDKLQTLLDDAQQVVARFEGEVQEKVETIRKLEGDLRSSNATALELEDLKVVVFERESEYLRLQQDKEQIVATTYKELEELRGTIAQREVDNLQLQLDTEQAMEAANRELEELRSAAARREADYHRLQRDSEHSAASAERELEDMKTAILRKESEYLRLQLDKEQALKTADKELEELKRVAFQRESERLEMQDKMAALRAECAHKDQQLDRYKQALDNLEMDREALENKHFDEANKRQRVEKVVEELTGRYLGLEIKLQERTEELHQMKNLKADLEEKIAALSREKAESCSNNEELARNIMNLEELRVDLEEKIVVQGKDQEELQRSLLGLQEELETSKTSLGQKDEDIARLQGMTVELQEKIGVLRVENVDKDAKLELEGSKVSSLNGEIVVLKDELASSLADNESSKKTIGELLEEIDSQLLKLKSKDSELALAKEEFSNRDLDRMQTINRLNAEVSSLVAARESSQSDLRLAKDAVELKQVELDDLARAKSQLDKQFDKTVKQHEKKIDLMALTIENLEKKACDLTRERDAVQAQFEDETQKVIALTAERGKLSGELTQAKNELNVLAQKMQEKERQCASKDDVIEKNSVDLLTLKLDVEMKANEIASYKKSLSTLEDEKTVTLKITHGLKEDLKKLGKEHKGACEELKVVANMKNSLKEKLDHFKENMNSVFAHFDVKKKNMQQSFEELKKFKKTKEAEIKQLGAQLNEARGEVEHLNEENHSMRKELQQRIDAKGKELKHLEGEIDALKIAEAGYLQEIAMLKEELNYTIDKYTEALSAEKEQKAESALQIKDLTESVHAMLTKYNGLEKEHKELTDVLEYNTKNYEEIKTAKDALELEIVRLKAEYEADASNCKREFQSELGTLQKIEKSLKQDVKDLRDMLETCKEEGSTVARELQDAKAHLHIIQCEKAELTNKLDALELTNAGMRKEYDGLKIAKEAYMKESKAALIEKQDKLKEETRAHEAAVADKEKEIARLKKEVSKYAERARREEDAHKRELAKKKKETGELHTSIANFLQNIEKLNKEKTGLEKKIEQHQKLVEFSKGQEETIADNLKQIQNLQISKDVLEAGKRKMEKMMADLEERQATLEKQMKEQESTHEASRAALQAQSDKTLAQLRDSEQLVREKCAEIEAANEEFDSVQTILTSMTKKMEASSRQLSVIHEDYEGKLKAERVAFEELREQHASSARELEYMSGLNGGLESELAEAARERVELLAAMREKEDLIAEMQRKYDSVASLVGAKDASIASLQAQLAAGLGRLADAVDARRALEDEHRRAAARLAQLEAQREESVEKHAGALRAVEENLLRAEAEVREVAARLESAECGRGDVDKLLEVERQAKEFLQRRVVDLEAQVHEAKEVKGRLAANIRRIASLVQEREESRDVEGVDDAIDATEQRIVVIIGKLRDLESIKEVATHDKLNAERSLKEMEACNQQLSAEKAILVEEYEKLRLEREALMQDKAKESKSLENMKVQYEALKLQQHSSTQLEDKLQHLEATNKQQYQLCSEFLKKSQGVFKSIEVMVSDRNQIEQVVGNLRELYINLQLRSIHVTEATHKLQYEQKCALEIIIDDINKQFRRLSKMIYNLNLKCHQVVEKAVSAILDDKSVDWSTLFKELSGDEIVEKLEDLKDNANNTQVQLEEFLATIEALPVKEEKARVLKENLLPAKQPARGEDDWRKKYLGVKQKLTLVENSKNNFEKKLKQLRDENKRLCERAEKPVKVEPKQESKGCGTGTVTEEKPTQGLESDQHYKKLLHDYIQLKEQHQEEIAVWSEKCKKLEGQLSSLYANVNGVDGSAAEELQGELAALKTSYRDLKVAFSKLQLDYSALEQLLSERNEQLSALANAKESYSALCEENTKLKSEIDTLKYKRQRDREEFLRHVKKLDAELADKVTGVRAEYDLKLDKMKEKIVEKYREQVDQNETGRHEKMAALRAENEHYRSTVGKLKEELGRAHAKNDILDSEKQHVMQQLRVARERDDAEFDFKEPAALTRRASSHSLHSETRSAYVEERRNTFSLPRNAQPLHQQMDIIEEVRYRRRTSSVAQVPTELQMEDEGDMFNNKYLHDLKEGRPSIATGRESASSRLSEFAYRNSLCPPHLKSSYPAETQFLDHRQFKEDDLKSGNIDFMDDSMKTHLLPTDKPKKKDAGTTSYKRPGPPTPSKHGGRLSLQGNERVLRENAAEQKRNPANPLRSLFSSSSKKVAAAAENGCNGENAATSPKKRPSLSFFRR